MVIALDDYGLIKVSGATAANFLQGQLTCDVREITSTQTKLGAYCNVKGRVVSLFRIFLYQNDFYLWLPKSLISITLTTLAKYAIFSKVTVTDVSEQWTSLGCYGEKVTENLIHYFGEIPQQINELLIIKDCILICLPGTPPRYLVLCASKNAATVLKNISFENKIGTLHEWNLQDIYMNIPILQRETSELFTPHMLNLPALQAVSFNKGCYLGQEVIARTEFLGKTKRELKRVQAETLTKPQAGTKLYNENKEEIGQIVNAEMIANNICEILAVLSENTLSQKIFTENYQSLLNY